MSSSRRDMADLFAQSGTSYQPREMLDCMGDGYPHQSNTGPLGLHTTNLSPAPADQEAFPVPVLPKAHASGTTSKLGFCLSDGEPSRGKLEKWETPTSLISRLTAGLATSMGQDDRGSGNRSCASPSISESSEASSFFLHREPYHCEDPFLMAHQELVEEVPKPLISKPPKLQERRHFEEPAGRQGRSHSQASSESMFSEEFHGDSSTYGSLDSDSEDEMISNYLTSDGHLPDIDSLLTSIKEPDLIPYVPDKADIHKYLKPHEVGHINHLIKSLSDAMLNISLPETLYKNKGFTPLDYMDIHLNSVIRLFFFVFKNEDFLNLMLTDQIALLESCSLRAVCCSGLYLFNKESGCWHIPGATGKFNHPVIHISDLLQVYPKHFVSRTFELHKAAAKLNFDWPMGVIAQCILMYTPIDKVVSEPEKVDNLRNKYVGLLLKYVTWKHGTYNASQVFPEVLKLLDAILLVVEELATITLNLTEEEVEAIEDRLSTFSQICPFPYEANNFKDTKPSLPSLKHIRLGEVQKRLCRAIHDNMLETLQSNSSDWSGSKMIFSSFSNDSAFISPPKLVTGKGLTDASKSNGKDLMSENEFLAEKDLMLLRRFLEDVTSKENSMIIQGIKEKMDSNLIKLILDKLCS